MESLLRLKTRSPIAGFAVQMGYCDDDDIIAFDRIDHTIRKAFEAAVTCVRAQWVPCVGKALNQPKRVDGLRQKPPA